MWEIEVLDALQNIHTPWLDKIMVAITSLGNAGILCIVLAAVLLVLTRWVKFTKNLHPILFILASAAVGVVFGF